MKRFIYLIVVVLCIWLNIRSVAAKQQYCHEELTNGTATVYLTCEKTADNTYTMVIEAADGFTMNGLNNTHCYVNDNGEKNLFNRGENGEISNDGKTLTVSITSTTAPKFYTPLHVNMSSDQAVFVEQSFNGVNGTDIEWGTCACALTGAKVVAEGYSAVKIRVDMADDCEQTVTATNTATGTTVEIPVEVENGVKYIYLKGLASQTEYTYTFQTKDASNIAGKTLTFATRCNIAEGKTATASSNNGLMPDRAVDGKGNAGETRWQAGSNKPGEWWQVNLGEPTDVSAIEIVWEQAWAKTFEIAFSADGTTWTNQQTVTQDLKSIQGDGSKWPYTQLIALPQKRQAQYVRFTLVEEGNNAPSFYEFRVLNPNCVATPEPVLGCEFSGATVVAEGYSAVKIETDIKGDCQKSVLVTDTKTHTPLEVPVVEEDGKKYIYLTGLDPQETYTRLLQAKDEAGALTPAEGIEVTFATRCNIAEKKTATASSGTAGNAIDNDAGSRWESVHGNDAEWWQVDLDGVQTVYAIEILWEGAWGKEFNIAFSKNGTDWTQQYVEQDLTGASFQPYYTQLIALPEAQTARYVRFEGIKRGTGYGYSFYEFRVLDQCKVDFEFVDAEVAVEGVHAAKVAVDVTGATAIVATPKGTTASKEYPIIQENGTKYILLTGLDRATNYEYTLQAKNSKGELTDGIDIQFATRCNIAEGQTSYASSAEGGNVAGNANDGNTETIWDSSYNSDQTWQVIFGTAEKQTKVSAIEIVWGRAYPKTFTLNFSENDNQEAQMTVSVSNPGDGVTTLVAVDPNWSWSTTHVVHFKGGERGTNWGYSIREFRVTSPDCGPENLVYDKRYKGSESHPEYQNDSKDPGTANNGDHVGNDDKVVWRTKAHADIWWQADLHTYKDNTLTDHRVYALDQVLLYWREDNGACTPKNMRIDIAYTDEEPTEKDWYSVAYSGLLTPTKDNNNQIFTFDLSGADITARWIRIFGTGGANNAAGSDNGWGYRLTEVEGYGDASLKDQHTKPEVTASVVRVSAKSAQLRLGGSDVDQQRKVHCFHVVNTADPEQYWNISLQDGNEMTIAGLQPDTYYELSVYSLDEWGEMSEPQTVCFSTLYNCSGNMTAESTVQVYASSSQDNTMLPAMAKDDNGETRWGSAWNGMSDVDRQNQWFLVDLGEGGRTVNEVAILWETASAARFRLLYAEDGADVNTANGSINGGEWKLLHDQATDQKLSYVGATAESTYPFDPVEKVRWVKFQGVATATNWGYSFWEFRVSGCDDIIKPDKVYAKTADATCSMAAVRLSGHDLNTEKEETVVDKFVAYPLDGEGNERPEEEMLWTIYITNPGDTGTFLLQDLEANTLYRYRVYAMDNSRNISEVYAELEFTTPECEFVIYHHGQKPDGELAVEEFGGGIIKDPIAYKRRFVPGRWETLCLPFEVDSITVKDEDDTYKLYAQYNDGTTVPGEFWLRTFTVKGPEVTANDFQANWEDIKVASQAEALPEKNVAYIMMMPDFEGYYDDKFVVFHGGAGQEIASGFVFPALLQDDYYSYSGNTTMMPQHPTSSYVLDAKGDYFVAEGNTVLYPFEGMVNATALTIARMPRLGLNKQQNITTDTPLPATAVAAGVVYSPLGGYMGAFDGIDQYGQLLQRLPPGIYVVRCGPESYKMHIAK